MGGCMDVNRRRSEADGRARGPGLLRHGQPERALRVEHADLPRVRPPLSPHALLALVNFFICRILYGYLIVYAAGQRNGGGGAFVVNQLRLTYVGLVVLIFLVIGIFSARAPSFFPVAVAIMAFAIFAGTELVVDFVGRRSGS